MSEQSDNDRLRAELAAANARTDDATRLAIAAQGTVKRLEAERDAQTCFWIRKAADLKFERDEMAKQVDTLRKALTGYAAGGYSNHAGDTARAALSSTAPQAPAAPDNHKPYEWPQPASTVPGMSYASAVPAAARKDAP